MTEKEEMSWTEEFTTITVRRADVKRLRALAQPRIFRKHRDRKLESNFEIFARALDALEQTDKSG